MQWLQALPSPVILCRLALSLFCLVMCLRKGRQGSFPRRSWRACAPSLGKVCYVYECYSVNGGSALHWAGFNSPKTKKHRFSPSLADGYAILISPSKGSRRSHPLPIIPLCLSWEEFFFLLIAGYSKGETAVHGCHCSRDIAVRMRDVMARPCVSLSVPIAVIYW